MSTTSPITTTVSVSGMTCGHCVSAVQNALAAMPGVEVNNVAIGSADIEYDATRTPLDRIVKAIEDEGYQVGPTQLRRAQSREST